MHTQKYSYNDGKEVVVEYHLVLQESQHTAKPSKVHANPPTPGKITGGVILPWRVSDTDPTLSLCLSLATSSGCE